MKKIGLINLFDSQNDSQKDYRSAIGPKHKFGGYIAGKN